MLYLFQVSTVILINLTLVELLNIVCQWTLYIVWYITQDHSSTEVSSFVDFLRYTFNSLYMLSVFVVTLDMLFSVTLNMQYQLVITKRKFVTGLVLMWIFSVVQGKIMVILRKEYAHIILAAWEVALLIFVIATFVCVFMITRKRRRQSELRGSEYYRGSLNYRPSSRLPSNCRVPTLLITTHICFVMIPHFVKLGMQQKSFTVVIVHYLNSICDPIIYIFASKRMRERVFRLWSPSDNVGSSTSTMSTVGGF